jgi:hypothetical protein
MVDLKFKNTMYAMCLYHGTFNNEFILFFCMVDDFSITCALEQAYTLRYDQLDMNWQVPMSNCGMMKHFNIISSTQSTTHISISNKTYLNTIFKNYDLTNSIPASLPMNPSNEFVRALGSSTPLEPDQHSKTDNGSFRYRASIGELVWPMITIRPELSYPVVKLSQFASNRASIHYNTMFGIFQYLSGKHDEGLTYTHTIAMMYGPIIKYARLSSNPTDRVDEHVPKVSLKKLFGYSNNDWEMDIRH